jgi:hypothetical protein
MCDVEYLNVVVRQHSKLKKDEQLIVTAYFPRIFVLKSLK